MIENPYTQFGARAYIDEYCASPDGENTELLRFHARAHRQIPPARLMLELGGGPTIYQLISAAAHTDEIHFADYLDGNVRTVQEWQAGDEAAYDWTPFIRRALEVEGDTDPSDDAIAARQDLVRSKLKRFLHADALAAEPIGTDPPAYDKVAVNFVFESITDKRDDWRDTLLRVARLVKVGGHFINVAVADCSYWFIGGVRFPGLPITADDYREILPAAGFSIRELEVIKSDTQDPAADDYRGYQSIVAVLAQRER